MNNFKYYKLPEKYKYSLTFASKIKPVISEDKDKYLALASSSNLKKYLPTNIDFSKKIDFLPFAGNAFVANRLNLNDDGISTKEALALAELFPYSFVDVEHDRTKLIGVILNASFSEFGTNKELTKDEVSKLNSPFNVSIGGVIWKAVNPDLSELIEESDDPDSELLGKICLSWELAFSDFNLILIDPKKKNFEDGEIITDTTKINELEAKLKSYGGSGVTDNGKKVGRIPVGDVIPLGVGLTTNPAAEVGSIIVKSNEKTEKSEENKASSIIELINEFKKIDLSFTNVAENLATSLEKVGKNENNLSQIKNDNVKESSKFMKINSIKDLTDDNLKEIKASQVQEFFDSEIKRISDEYQNKNKEKDDQIKAANENIQKVENQCTEIKKQFDEVSKQLNTLISSNAEKEKIDIFSARMETIQNKFDLNEKQNAIVAEELKSIGSDEDFNKFLAKAEILFEKNKKNDNKVENKDKKTEEIKASIENVVEDAIKNGEKDKVIPPNTQEPPKPSLAERAKLAFGKDGWEVQKINKR